MLNIIYALPLKVFSILFTFAIKSFQYYYIFLLLPLKAVRLLYIFTLPIAQIQLPFDDSEEYLSYHLFNTHS